jgi:hypothetical protein
LLAVFAIGMDTDMLRVLRPQQMQRKGHHHGALVEVVLLGAFRLPDAVRWWRQSRHEILEIQSNLPNRASGPTKPRRSDARHSMSIG